MKPIALTKIKKGDYIMATCRKSFSNYNDWDNTYFEVKYLVKDKEAIVVKKGYFINEHGDSFIIKKPEPPEKGEYCLIMLNIFKFYKLTKEEWDSVNARAVIDILGDKNAKMPKV